MTTTEILDYLEVHKSIILTLAKDDIPKVKARLSNKRSRDKLVLPEEESTRLAFKTLPYIKEDKDEKPHLALLRITIVSESLPVLDITPAEDF